MSKNFTLEELLVTAPKDISEDTKSVDLEIDIWKVPDFDKKEEVIEKGIGYLQEMTNAMAHHNATHAHALFEEHENLDEVISSLSYGGVDLNVVTHRNFQEGDGETLEFFTQAQVNTDVGRYVNDVLAELDFDNE